MELLRVIIYLSHDAEEAGEEATAGEEVSDDDPPILDYRTPEPKQEVRAGQVVAAVVAVPLLFLFFVWALAMFVAAGLAILDVSTESLDLWGVLLAIISASAILAIATGWSLQRKRRY